MAPPHPLNNQYNKNPLGAQCVCINVCNTPLGRVLITSLDQQL